MKRLTFSMLLILTALWISACRGGGQPGGDDAPDVEIAATVDPALNPGYTPPPEIEAARDAALAFVAQNYPDNAPFEGITWAGANVTPEGLVGSVQYRFQSGGWILEISHGVVAPEDLEYLVILTQPETGFRWSGTVTPSGQVTEAAVP